MSQEGDLPFLWENQQWVDALWEQYEKAPDSLPADWRAFFEGASFGLSYIEKGSSLEEKVASLVDAYRSQGHLLANINPLKEASQKGPSRLDLKYFGFTETDLEQLVPSSGFFEKEQVSLKELTQALKETYCGTVGIEYKGFVAPELEGWLEKRVEKSHFRPSFSLEKKKNILGLLNKAELFETFLHTKYVGQKRFSLEGLETLIPLLQEIIESGGEKGIEECVLGMSHRGRLNVLVNILKKSFSMVFSEFEDFYDPSWAEGIGDVKYHKGFSANVSTLSGKEMHIALTANPSHLESVDPVVEGKVRAKQHFANDQRREKILPILLHGDAALAGQGVVYETLQLYRLPGYATGGTIHIVLNNQIGFTTLPEDGRSTRYCTDIAKAFGAPVFHLNSEDPEGCILAAQLAMEIRQTFHCDVFLDLIGYRKYGHNEGDEPFFTQPLEYQSIRKHSSIRMHYRDQLEKEGGVESKIAESLEKEFEKQLHFELDELKLKKEPSKQEAFSGVWKGYRKGSVEDLFVPVKTGVKTALLHEMVQRFTTIPEGFSLHPKVARFLEERKKSVQEDPATKLLEWSFAEYLAFASLLWEGRHVRLAGQDSQRGTFSQRHAAWIDQETGKTYIPLRHLKEGQGDFEVWNSLLSEYAAVGFEFGYSLSYPSALVLWEAQFGDFANGAQIIIDQYLSCSEAKWERYSGLVLLLPHGYEGQGSEHSSARMERFLQLAAEGNYQIVNPTTPAQYFHLLRRQVVRDIRKPLIVFTPKGLLRHPLCMSSFNDCGEEKRFYEILEEENPSLQASLLVVCSGRVYYDLLQEKEKLKTQEVALIRLEQIAPFPKDLMQKVFLNYPNATKVLWVQEEPLNMGAADYLMPLLHASKPASLPLKLIGRARSASPASGSHKKHAQEREQLMQKVFSESRKS